MIFFYQFIRVNRGFCYQLLFCLKKLHAEILRHFLKLITMKLFIGYIKGMKQSLMMCCNHQMPIWTKLKEIKVKWIKIMLYFNDKIQ